MEKVLVVDDDPDVAQLIQISLELEGFKVIKVLKAKEAFQKALVEQPDLIILDIMMPDIDGWQIYNSLRYNPLTTSIPVIILTAKAQEADIKQGKELGVSDYITKPFHPIELAKKVKSLLKLRDKERDF